MIKIRNLISAFVIITMASSIFTLPILTNDAVQAATKKVKITYNVNNGKFSAKKYKTKKSYTKKIKKGKKAGTLPKVKRTGYSLKGWYTKKSGGKKVTAKTKIKKDTKLYARWKANSYTATFDARNGNSPVSKKVKFDKKYSSVLTAPKLPGNKFMGWYTSPSGGKKVTKQSSTKKITLYAHWEITDKLGIDSKLLGLLGEKRDKIITDYNLALDSQTELNGNKYYLYSNQQNDTAFIFQENKCIAIVSNISFFLPKLNNSSVSDSEIAKIYGKGVYNPTKLYTQYKIGEIYFYTNEPNYDGIIEEGSIASVSYEFLSVIFK